MKITTFKHLIPIVLVTGILISSCRKEEVPVIIPKATEVNTFIFNGLRDYYLWNSMIPPLNKTIYNSNKDSLNLFLNKYSDPQVLFTNLLFKPDEIDKWSIIADDSKTIEDWIAGISETMGFDIILGRIAGTADNVFGSVRYVYKGSPAEKSGVKRGDIFTKINDQQLTISNYRTLLFTNKTYTMGFILPSKKSVTMTAIEMQEDPIHKDTVFIVNNQKIGYLVYNSFSTDYDFQLNDVFLKFKEAGIDQLVLDLRYNGGGSVQSSIYLASMIYGTDATKVFSQSSYNSGLQALFIEQYGPNALKDFFVTTIEKTTKHSAAPINTLNLKKIYFIVSDNTASASELLINGLKPYMKVTLVGINTVGKYTGSFTIKDVDDKGNVNPNHKYAMQPIVVKFTNSIGDPDFVNGIIPNIEAEEDIINLLPFGDPNETLLSEVLADIKGNAVTGKILKSARIGLTKIADSHDFKPYANEMYINPIQKIKPE